jgi:hypothetical protein
MKKKATSSQPELPAVGATAKPAAPVLDRKTAKSVPAYRHEKTARTVALHQPAGDAGVHLFGATGIYVATVTAAEAAANEPAAAAVDSPESSVQSPEAPVAQPSV